MTKKNIRVYLQNLRNTRDSKIGKVPPDIQTKINKIVDLYEDRKISQYGTAMNLIKDISQTDTRSERKNGLKKYEKAMAKYEDAEPITERMAKTAKKARTGKEAKAVVKKHDKQPIFKRKAISGLASKAKELYKNRKTYDVKFMLFSIVDRDGTKKPAFKLDGIAYYPIMLKPKGSRERAVGEANAKANQFIETLVSRKIRKYNEDERHLFRKVMLIMNTSSEFQELGHMIDYADAIRIESVELVDIDTADFDERDEPLRQSGQNVSIYYRYIQTQVDTESLTIKQALQKKNYKENECWINALLENFEGSNLMREKRQRKDTKTLTRDKVLELLEMNEEEFINNGASVNQMDKVFKFFNIPVRLYNFIGNLIYEYNPNNYLNGKVKMFRGLVKNKHIYLLNHDLEKLCQKTPDDTFKAPTTGKFYITDKNEPLEYKMFSNVDELLQMREQDEYALIHSENDMVKVFHQLNDAGYKPYIKYGNSGQIANIMCKFYYKQLKKYVKYNIASQSLSKDRMDEDVEVDDGTTYNNIVKAMFKLQKEMFKQNHLSYYNDVDIQILKDCKTIVPIGRMPCTPALGQHNCPSGYFIKDVASNNLCEIDIRKAFTHAGCCIKYIPRFTEFDIFKPFKNECDVNELNSLTLYIVEVYEGNIFFNKKYNLVYGKFLNQLIKHNVKLKILWYKQPNHVYKVNYKK